MKKTCYNVRLIAVNNPGASGFSIYISFSGRREYLTNHRHNGLLYSVLANGVRLEELERMSYDYSRNKARQSLCDAIRYVVRTAQEYIRYEHIYDFPPRKPTKTWEFSDERCA